MATVRVFAYENEAPSNDKICQVFQLFKYADLTYLVSTKAQSNERKKLLTEVIKDRSKTSHQFEKDDPKVVFHEFLRHSINKKFLSRTEERLFLLRAAHEISEYDPEIHDLLRNDVITWRDIFAEMAQRGLDFSEGIKPEDQRKLVTPRVGEIIQRLQSKYKILKQEKNLTSFEEDAYKYLESIYKPTECVVMEGFTFLTPLQQKFIERITQVSDNTEVKILVPYREAQELGFEVIQRTYFKKNRISKLLDNQSPEIIDKKENQNLDELEAEKQSRLVFLQRNLFSSNEINNQVKKVSFEHLDNSVYIEAYSHRNQEIIECIKKIETYIKSYRFLPETIAIVTRNRGDFHTVLQEEVERHDLRDFDGNKISLGFQPRQLLLTPLGNFVLILYQIWKDDCLQMTDEQFESILTSGWLGANLQKTVENFSSVKAQIFATCTFKKDWLDKLNKLSDLHKKTSKDSRSTVASIEDNSIDLWFETIVKIESICKKLFSFGEQTISNHIKKLLDELNYFEPESMFKAEKEVLARIKDVFQELDTNSSPLKISPEEFGDIINSISKERNSPEEEEPLETNTIWLTTPEGIDGRQKDVVFYLGLDNNRVPRLYPEPFPFYKDDIDEHQEKERYFFLSVVRSAKKHLHLTYSKKEQDQSLSPSLYLNQASKLIEQSINNQSSLSTELYENLTPVQDLPPLGEAIRENYSLAEIAHFALCPMRYKLETLNSKASRYKERFQIRFLAQGEWLTKIFEKISKQPEIFNDKLVMQNRFFSAVEETDKEIQYDFCGLRSPDFQDIKNKVQNSIVSLIERYFQRSFPISIQKNQRNNVYFYEKDEQRITISCSLDFCIKQGLYSHPYLDNLIFKEWNLPKSKGYDSDLETTTIKNILLFANLIDAVTWWRKATTYAFKHQSPNKTDQFIEDYLPKYQQTKDEIKRIVNDMEAGIYPKNPGKHCDYCPARSECLGLEEEV